MLEEDALVVESDDEYAWVEAQSSSSCNHCSANQGCGTASLQKWFNRKPNRLKVINTKSVKTGDKVVIGIPEQALVKGSFLIYMLPILALIVGAIAGSLVNDWMNWGIKEGLSIITGFVSFLLCFKWLAQSRLKYTHQADYQPIILRISY